MKIKLFIIVTLSCVMYQVHLQAQVMKNDRLDSAYFRIIYQVNQLASKNGKEVIITDSLILDVGQKWSAYYDLNKIRRDSLTEADFRKNPMKSLSLNTNQDALQARLEAKSEIIEIIDESKGESMQVFKNREKHNITVFDKGPLEGFDILTNYKLTEVIPPQEWKITRDTLTVLGYICNKGTSTFRGRTYHAWFTLDIPINDGPWKLYGLPGLILRVEDEDEFFTFEAIGLQKVESFEISFPTDKKIVPCNSSEELHKFRKNRFKDISIGFSDSKGGITYFKTKNPVTFNELELE